MKPNQQENPVYNEFSGTLISLVIGDVLGADVEFKPRGTFKKVTDMRGGVPIIYSLAPVAMYYHNSF